MPVKEARIEQISVDGSGWHYYLVTDHGAGQARMVLDFDHEPTRGEVNQAGKEWLKSLHSPPALWTISIGKDDE
jgi:hypothetical protein